MRNRLSDEEIRDVLARAEEIHLRSRMEEPKSDAELILQAAEEAGLPRDAVEQAIQERFEHVGEPPKVGELVFAPSADEKLYVAEVLTVTGQNAKIRFLKGSEHNVALSSLRPASFLPGQKVVAPWKHWGDWTCTVVSYNSDTRKVKVSDGWGSTDTFKISEVYLPKPRKPGEGISRAKAVFYGYLGGLLTGLGAGSVLWWFFLR